MTVARRNKLKSCCDSESDEDYRQDLVHELSRRLDTLRRCEQYIINANGHAAAIEFWQDVHQQEADNIERLRALLVTAGDPHSVRRDPHMLCDSGELLSVSSIEFHRTTVRRVPVA